MRLGDNNKKKYLAVSCFLAVTFVGAIFFLYSKEKKITPTVKINQQLILVEIADTAEEQRKGLSGRQSLCPECGMLFIFNEKQRPSFWMKDMLFPIDIIWINENIIVGIDANLPVEPAVNGQFKYYQAPGAITSVLEVNAGFTTRHNIRKGDGIKFENLL